MKKNSTKFQKFRKEYKKIKGEFQRLKEETEGNSRGLKKQI